MWGLGERIARVQGVEAWWEGVRLVRVGLTCHGTISFRSP